MGARSGNNYLSALKRLNAELWIDGERARDTIAHPRLANSARAIASLYDMQMERPEAMTFRIDDGGRAAMSFIQPASAEDLRRRARMTKAWADYGCGFIADTPDRANAVIAATAAAQQLFAAAGSRYGDNIRNYYLESRSHDWCAALAINPPVQAAPPAAATGLKLIEKSGAGIVVEGSLAAGGLAAIAEELIVLPAAILEPGTPPAPALAFAVPCNTKGLKLVCETGSIEPRGRLGYPLSSRFDQVQCTAVLENVAVPWERVFLCGESADAGALYAESGAAAHAMHQRAINGLAKCEFLLGLAACIARVAGSVGPTSDRIGTMAAIIETMRARLSAGEANARPNKWGIFAPDRDALDGVRAMSSRLLPRLGDAIRPFGSNQDLSQSDRDDSRLAAFRGLAWDATSSAMALRQMPREPILDDQASEATAGASDDSALASLIERVEAFLARPD